MQGFENHLRSAASQFSNGDLKDAYLNYLLAAQSLLHKLSTETVFEDNNRINSQPEYVQSLFSISAKCLRSAEDIVCNRCIYSPSAQVLAEEEERERENDIMDTPISASPNIVTVEATLPLIPLSPLTQMSIIHSSSLASASQKLTLAKRSKTPVGLPTLRRLTEDVRIQRGKLDSVNKQIKSVADAVICNWNPDAVAKQLTIIEAQLFSKLSIRQDFLSSKSRITKIRSCLDFHRYITNSIVHQIIAGSDVSNSASREYPRDYIIAHIIRVAYLLLHVYRNFSGFAAIVKALTCPEVRRLRKSWKKVPGKTKEMLKDLSRHIKEENKYRSYHEALSYKLDEVKEFGPGLVVIPWVERHLERLEAILKSYSTGRKPDTNKFDPSLYLSEPGARKLEAILHTLEQCQGNPSEDKFTPERSKTPRRRTFMEIDGAKSQIALPSNLLDIGGTDLGLHHWLVSRVYLTRYQLWEESLEYEAPAFGELVPTFVKENGQTLVESHHMGHHTDTDHFEDVGQFNDYFPSEGNRSSLDLDKMESVDEFLSFLDQDLVESSTPNTLVLPDIKEDQQSGLWDEENHTPNAALLKTPDSQFSVEKAFEKAFPVSQNSKAVPEILDDFKLDTPSPQNSILFNSVKPPSNSVNIFQDDFDLSGNSSPLSPNGLGIFSPVTGDDTQANGENGKAGFIPINDVKLDSPTKANSQPIQLAPNLPNEKSDVASSQCSEIEEEAIISKSIVEDAHDDCRLLDNNNVQESILTTRAFANSLDSELPPSTNNNRDESPPSDSREERNDEEASVTKPFAYDRRPLSSNGADKHQSLFDSSECENVESIDKHDRHLSIGDTIDLTKVVPPKLHSDIDQKSDSVESSNEYENKISNVDPAKEAANKRNSYPQEVLDSNGQKTELTDDSSYVSNTASIQYVDYPSNKPLSKDTLLKNSSTLAGSLSETPLNQMEEAVVADFHDDSSSEEEPRKFLSLEKLIRLNEPSYADEKSGGDGVGVGDGHTSITTTDEEIETTIDTNQITQTLKYNSRDLNGTNQDYSTSNSGVLTGNIITNPDEHGYGA